MVMCVTVRDLTAWDDDLRTLIGGLGWLFRRVEPRVVFGDFVRALIADVSKKNSWGLAEHAGYATPRPFEHLLDEAVWDVDVLRDAVRDYVLNEFATLDGVVVADDTQVIKKGRMSVGVAPQYCGLTGQVENCQVMPMLSYASEAGHAFIDRELYLPESWTDDPGRCQKAKIPAGCGFVTKPQLVIRMLKRFLGTGAPFRWFVADSGYGRDPLLRTFCHDNALSYVMGVPVDLPLVGADGVAIRPDQVLKGSDHRWERRSAGAGSKGERTYDWALHGTMVKDQCPADGFEFSLLIRRSKTLKNRKGKPAAHEIDYFLVHAPAGTTIAAMVRTVGMRWTIEDDNKTTKDQLGLDHYQVRKWTPWYRHITICMLAAAFLAVTRARLGKDLPDPESEPTC